MSDANDHLLLAGLMGPGVLIATYVAVSLVTFLATMFVVGFRQAKKEMLQQEAELAGGGSGSGKKVTIFRVAGRNVAAEDWSPEVLEQVKKDYFRPAAKDQALVLVDITATCPLKHSSSERVAIVSKTIGFSHALADALPRTRANTSCKECGKSAHLSAKSISWEGKFSDWDGAI